MVVLRVFVFLAVTLFVRGCAFAEATVPAENTKEKAEKGVTELQELTGIVLGHAEAKLRLAENTNSDVESQKNKAESAEAAVRTAAGKITADKGKEEADAIAEKAKNEWTNCQKLHQAAKTKAEGVSDSLKELVTSAKEFVEKAKIDIPADSSPPDDFAKVIQNATTVTGLTTTLSQKINESTVLADSDDALVKFKDSAKKIEVFKYQAESIAVVSLIETALKTAETDIQNIPQKKEEIDTIVQAVNTKCKSASGLSKSSLSSLCTTAKSQLQIAADKVQEAQQCSKDIQGKKTQVSTDLTTLMNTDDETKAGGEAEKIKGHEGFIDGKLKKIKGALQAADDAFNSAKGVQQQMQTEISQHNSQSGSELNNKKQQDNEPREDVTNSIPNGEAKNPAITETDKTSLGKSEKTMDKASEQPVDANLENTKQNQSTELTHTEKPNPTDDKSKLLNNDQLRNITKDITKNPLIGGGVPKRSAANDSAVTVFIPLLVILVISAVLH